MNVTREQGTPVSRQVQFWEAIASAIAVCIVLAVVMVMLGFALGAGVRAFRWAS